MSIYYSQRVQPLKALYDIIASICSRHIAITYFDSGDLDSLNTENMTFPAAYLETINEIQESKGSETYSISLNILDRQVTDGTSQQKIEIHDKLKQIFTEIKLYMEQKKVFGAGVGDASILLFNDFDDASLVRLRADFTLTVEPLITPTLDLASIFPENG